jgi:hypothetical protein
MGFSNPRRLQVLDSRRVEPNFKAGLAFGQSGWNRSSPVVPGYGGSRPGQILDKPVAAVLVRTPPSGRERRSWPASPEVAFVELIPRRRHRPLTKKKRCRSRAEIENERRELFEKYQREIDAIVAEYHDRLPRTVAKLVGAMYARFSSKFQDSVTDQVRALFEVAVREGIFVPRENIFFDMAVRGYRNRRPGLAALQVAIEGKQFDILLVLHTSRLFRKLYKAMQFVEEEIVERGLHCLFKNWVDTRDEKQWRMKLQFAGTLDEATTGMYAENVRAAHQSLLAKRRVFSTLPFGYRGEPIPGEFTKRGKPQCLIVIDAETAPYVKRIFDWFALRLVPIDEVARRLNDDPDAPAPPKSTTGRWTHKSLHDVLENECYRGVWSYGRKEAKWLSKKDYSIRVAREQPLSTHFYEELRIIDDDLWFAVQRLLHEQLGKGRKPASGDPRSRPRLLNGLFRCAEHDQPLYVGGAHGKSMYCKACYYTSRDQRPLYSKLNRVVALRKTCETLATLIRSDESLIQDAISACQLHVEELKRPDPATLDTLKVREVKLTEQIRFNLRNAGTTQEEQAESAAILRELRAERTQVQAEMGVLEALEQRQIEVPSEERVRREIDCLSDILVDAATSDCRENIGDVRELIFRLTGGRIALYQQGEAKVQRGWLQGHFTLQFLDVLVERLIGVKSSLGGKGVEVSIDYRRPAPCTDKADKAYEMYVNGVLEVEIAKVLKLSKSRVTALLKAAHAARGEEMPDGRSRRSNLANKHQEPRTYQLLADAAVELMTKGFKDAQIAKKLGCRDFVIARAIRHWHSIRNLPVPTSRERREARARLAKQLVDSGKTFKEAAAELECSNLTLGLLLDLAYQLEGRQRPDGRSQRKARHRGQPPADQS